MPLVSCLSFMSIKIHVCSVLLFQIMVTAGCLKDAQQAVELVKDHGWYLT